ncbi:DUF805 domain-containing protein [Oceanibaculum nanhaiense]|uniref:DUF805 domain-containing protein n=1 Tax=Oceanibaculum nanhaiense TaxID=1909734 RepID=UPI000A3BD9DA|nr:DUF805 domain-containing protein [Oceanibaculum nanhaiense]
MIAGMEVVLVPAGLLGLAVFIVTIWASVRILDRIGHSGWWVLIGFVPVLNIAMIWALALQRWPIDDESDSGTGSTESGQDDSTLWSPETLKNAGPPDGHPEPPAALPPTKS